MNPEYFEQKTFEHIFKAIDELGTDMRAQGKATQDALAKQAESIASIEKKMSWIYGYASGIAVVASLIFTWIKSKVTHSA